LVPDLSGQNQAKRERRTDQVSLLYIILIVVIVLLLLGFFTRGRW
jgi:flagellar basal body-associated protein FliL